MAKALDAPTDIPDCKDADMRKRQNELNERLAAEGVLRRPPDPNRKPRKFSPARIKGKPLSETIIEERR
ncbi:MAG: hypothetical protein HOP17_03595 [Acidobacteria bacterium]|nr:hypothetical protein [Acidobacteriota bacterium]